MKKVALNTGKNIESADIKQTLKKYTRFKTRRIKCSKFFKILEKKKTEPPIIL